MAIHFHTRPAKDRSRLQDAVAFLSRYDLALDDDVGLLIEARDDQGAFVGCGGIAGDVLKSIAIAEEARGEGLALSLMTELVSVAWEAGHKDLFLYTKPENESLFAGCGFATLARVPGEAVLMENNKQRLPRYLAELAKSRKPGQRIASLVMNCNPFTLGHLHLITTCLERCDAAHLFVVKEDRSLIPYQDRLFLVRENVRSLSNLTVHEGSDYLISRATFPRYFLKDEVRVDRAHAGIDIQIFRNYIAPSLGLTHRFVGEEPFSPLTNSYNNELAFWLSTDKVKTPPLALEIIPRFQVSGEAVSASRVRQEWLDKGSESIRDLVPPPTFAYLNFHEDIRRKALEARALSQQHVTNGGKNEHHPGGNGGLAGVQ